MNGLVLPVLLAGGLGQASAFKVLTLGDSWAEYSGDTFAKYCRGAVQVNRGIGGTTAAQWRRGQGETSFAQALQAAGELTSSDVVVFSLGGNDFIPGCTKPVGTLTHEIQATMQALKAALGTQADRTQRVSLREGAALVLGKLPTSS